MLTTNFDMSFFGYQKYNILIHWSYVLTKCLMSSHKILGHFKVSIHFYRILLKSEKSLVNGSQPFRQYHPGPSQSPHQVDANPGKFHTMHFRRSFITHNAILITPPSLQLRALLFEEARRPQTAYLLTKIRVKYYLNSCHFFGVSFRGDYGIERVLSRPDDSELVLPHKTDGSNDNAGTPILLGAISLTTGLLPLAT